MTLPQIPLDDRRFQDLVTEARKRVAERCPEWTEHNVSDPGVTLIELFAWMTDMMVYRLNRVPDKLHVALLDLLGIELDPPKAADALLRFRLAGPAEQELTIQAYETEVTTVNTGAEEPVVFRVAEEFVIAPVRPAAFVLQRGTLLTSVPAADGVIQPSGRDQVAFSTPPQLGDAIYLGFAEPISQLVLRVAVEASRASGVGIDPDDPPLHWEVSEAAGQWVPAEVLSDTTGGFNRGTGDIEIEIPRTASMTTFAGRRLHWLRCRLAETTRSGRRTRTYAAPPRLHSVTAAPVGALVRATHAARQTAEVLGFSDGTPGQRFTVRHAPALPLDTDDEALEVRVDRDSEWVRWERCETFDDSDENDEHYRFDPSSGEIELGPAIRMPSSWKQRGKVPPKGAQLRMSAYRYGGGSRGVVAKDKLTVLRKAIPGVSSVTNPQGATGGVDAETLEAGRDRAAYEMRARYRAVTADDFEFLAGEASPEVARARCLDPDPGEAVPVFVLARVPDPERHLSVSELTPDDDLLREVKAFLDVRRLAGSAVHVAPIPLVPVTVVADVRVNPYVDPDGVKSSVTAALYRFVNPLVGGDADGPSRDGWDFERPLGQGELFGLLEDVPGVERVEAVEMYLTDPATRRRAQHPVGARLVLRSHELPCSAAHVVRVRPTVDHG